MNFFEKHAGLWGFLAFFIMLFDSPSIRKLLYTVISILKKSF